MARDGAHPSRAGAQRRRRAIARRRWWPLARQLMTGAFLALVAVLLWRQAQSIEWDQVGAVLRAYPASGMLVAALLAAASHALYSTFDLLGRAWTGHRLRVATVMQVTFVSYVFNLNLGSLIGGAGFRFRLYTRLGLDTDATARVYALSVATNWLGYALLAGSAFAFGAVAPPAEWQIGGFALRALGAALVALALGYLWLCAWSKRRSYSMRGHAFELPPGRFALVQLALSVANWATIGALIFVLLRPYQVGYLQVLAVLLVAAVAGVLVHVPAGLGVIEVVFIALLGARIGEPQLLGALLAYRALYYLAPLVLALGVYARLEARAKRERLGGDLRAERCRRNGP